MAKKKRPLMKRIQSSLKEFHRFSELAVPQEFTGTTNPILAKQALNDFETQHHCGETISEFVDDYHHIRVDPIMEGGPTSIAVTDHETYVLVRQNLESLLSRNSLESYREEKGLTKIREKLINFLLQYISFERGIEKLHDHLVKAKDTDLDTLDRLDAILVRDKTISPEQELVRIKYKDLSAEDVVWLSLAKIPKRPLFQGGAPFFYPATMVDIDIGGLVYSYGYVDQRLENDIDRVQAHNILGLTGTSNQTQVFQFENNVHQILKAITLLSIDDQDLFKEIWKDRSETAYRRGDGMLVHAYLSNQGLISSDESIYNLLGEKAISRDDISKARWELSDYFTHHVKFHDGPVHSALDMVKLSGLLERIPNFILAQEEFDGYVRMYGTNIDFISSEGKVVDSVPLDDHIRYTTSYKFNDKLHDVSENKIFEEVIQRIRKKVYDEIIENEHQMGLDLLQAEIWEDYEIFVPVTIKKSYREPTVIEMLAKKTIDTDIIEQSLKFSFNEMRQIHGLLATLPRGVSRFINSIGKEVSNEYTLEALMTKRIKEAHYNPRNKQIVISLPISMEVVDEHMLIAYGRVAQASKRKLKEELKGLVDKIKHENYFDHCFLHEVGESIWAHMPKKLRDEWTLITPASAQDNPEECFLTPYSKEAQNEDFCEAFAIYFTHGSEFRKKAAQHPVLAKKYEFVQQMWSSDGEHREFDGSCRLPLENVHGSAKLSMVDLDMKRMVAESLNDYIASHSDRVHLRRTVYSYEDLEEIALEDEDTVNPIERAERRYDHSRVDEELELQKREDALRRYITLNVEKSMHELGVGVIHRDTDLLYKAIDSGDKEGAIEWFMQRGATSKSKVKKQVGALYRMFTFFEEDFGPVYLASSQSQAEKEESEYKDRYLGKLFSAEEGIQDLMERREI